MFHSWNQIGAFGCLQIMEQYMSPTLFCSSRLMWWGYNDAVSGPSEDPARVLKIEALIQWIGSREHLRETMEDKPLSKLCLGLLAHH